MVILSLLAAVPASAAARDKTKPKAAFTAPAVNAVANSKVTTTVSASDNKKVTKAQLYVAGKLAGTRTAAPWSLTANLAGRNGNIKLEWRVYDAAGNKAVVTRTIVADTTAPIVSITEGLDSTGYITGPATITAAASDNRALKRVEIIVNGEVVARDTTVPYTATIDGSTYGNITYYARATDTAGNTRTTNEATANGGLLAPPPVDAPDFSAPAVRLPVLISCTEADGWRTAKYEVTLTGGTYSMGWNPRRDYGWNNGSDTYTQTAISGWRIGSSAQPKVYLFPIMVSDPGAITPSHHVYNGFIDELDTETCLPVHGF